jgi:hypothetical protein
MQHFEYWIVLIGKRNMFDLYLSVIEEYFGFWIIILVLLN